MPASEAERDRQTDSDWWASQEGGSQPQGAVVKASRKGEVAAVLGGDTLIPEALPQRVGRPGDGSTCAMSPPQPLSHSHLPLR